MSSPFKALSPFAPRSIELNYAAFAPSCPEEPSFEAQLVVGDYLNNICGTNVDLGVLVGGSVHVINDILHSVGTLSVIIGTVQFTSDFSYTVLNNPSGKIIPCGQDTGLEFSFTVPTDPGDYGIFIQIPSNDSLSPCTYGYVFSVAAPSDPITYQWWGLKFTGPSDPTGTWTLLPGETNTLIEAWPYYDRAYPLYQAFRCVCSCPSGVAVAAGLTPTTEYWDAVAPGPYPFTVNATNQPSGPTSITSDIGQFLNDY